MIALKISVKNKLLLSSILLFVGVANAQSTKKDLVLGKWLFYEFTDSDATPEQQKVIDDGNKTNKGLIITFSPGNKFKSELKGGLKENNVQGNFKLLKNDQIVMLKDTFKIITLDNVYLKLYRDDSSPIAVFKRL